MTIVIDLTREAVLLHLLNKTLLFALVTVQYVRITGDSASAYIPLIALTIALLTTLGKSFTSPVPAAAAPVLLTGLCLWQPVFTVYLPLFAYDFIPDPRQEAPESRNRTHLAANVAGFCFLIPLFARFNLLTGLYLILAVILMYSARSAVQLREQLHRQRDHYEETYTALEVRLREQSAAAEKSRHLARLDERNRISRELHDVTGHTLSSALLQVGALEVINRDEAMTEPLEKLHETLDWGMSGIRDAVHGLYADSFDLKAELEKTLERAEGFTTRLNYPMTDDLPLELRFDILQIAREAVTNASKYSNGDRIEITVSVQPTLVALNICDNGTGAINFDSDNPSRWGIGLRSIREIVDRAKGLLNIGYEDKRGFIVHAVFFLNRGKDAPDRASATKTKSG